MKVTLEFTLPEEREEMEQAVKGHEYAAALVELDNNLRSLIKYNTELADDYVAGLQRARDILHQSIADHGVPF